MAPRAKQLQIRVTTQEKARLKRLARAAGQDVSAYVLSRALPSQVDRLAGIVRALRDDTDRRFALAELHDLLVALAPAEFGATLESMDVRDVDPMTQNYAAAMVEQAAHVTGVPAPAWTRDIAPLNAPHFATPLRGLRPYLLQVTPVPFRRRNIFTDAGIGARV